MLIAYNRMRLEVAEARLALKCEPTEVSFIRSCHPPVWQASSLDEVPA